MTADSKLFASTPHNSNQNNMFTKYKSAKCSADNVHI